MFIFLLTLMAMRSETALPDRAGGPRQKPPDLDDTETAPNYATAYFWDMYGATEAAM